MVEHFLNHWHMCQCDAMWTGYGYYLCICNLVYVEKANALVPVQKHLLIYLFGWNHIVDWSLFLVFERDKQNICYHTHVNPTYPYHLHNRKFDRVFNITRRTWLSSKNDSVDLILLNFCWNWTWNFIIDYKSEKIQPNNSLNVRH